MNTPSESTRHVADYYPTVLIEYLTSHRPRVLVEWAATRRQSASRRKGRCDNVTAT